MLLQQLRRARVGAVELGVEVLEEGGRLVELVLVGAAHAHRDDRDPLLHRGVQLEQAVRAAQHVARLEEQQDVALLHLVEQLRQVGEVVRVEEDGRAEHPLELRLTVPRLHRALELVVAEEGGDSLSSHATSRRP